MSAPGRWLRINVSCFESEWLAGLPAVAQHAWTRLLIYVKATGTLGVAKRMGPVAVERLWGIPPVSMGMMEQAAISDGALRIEDDQWVVVNWPKYQQPDRTNSLRKKRLRDKRKEKDTAGMGRPASGTRRVTETLTLTEKKTPLVSDEFLRIRAAYPKRAGNQPWTKAMQAWRARLKDGVTAAEMQAGVERYANYIRHTDKEGTEFVQMAATFFGKRGEGWKNEWAIPKNGNGKVPSHLQVQRSNYRIEDFLEEN